LKGHRRKLADGQAKHLLPLCWRFGRITLFASSALGKFEQTFERSVGKLQRVGFSNATSFVRRRNDARLQVNINFFYFSGARERYKII